MKLLVIGDEKRTRKYLPDLPIVDEVDLAVMKRGSSDDDLLACAGDVDFILADAISPVSARLIRSMPNLKLIHSEGVAFDLIDLAAARERGVTVCNNAGVNAAAVAEQTVLLMLACLRDVVAGDDAVRAGLQIQAKERMMVEGIRELGDCKVGFVGFGAIAQATAMRLSGWGCHMAYNKRTPLSSGDEERLNVRFESLDDLVATSDIVSLHVPVTDETRAMVDDAFFSRMKNDAILINTARGEIVDQEALARALEHGSIAAAGCDTLSPEPVSVDHPLLKLPPAAAQRVVLSPHIGGVTEGMFYRAHRMVWENVARVALGQKPLNIVS